MPMYHTMMIVCDTCPASVIVPAIITQEGGIDIVRGRGKHDGTTEWLFDQKWVNKHGLIQCPTCADSLVLPPKLVSP